MKTFALLLAALSLAACGGVREPPVLPDSFTHPEALYRVAVPPGYAVCARSGGGVVAVNEGALPLGCLASFGTPAVSGTRYEAGFRLEIHTAKPDMPGKSKDLRMRGERWTYTIAREENGMGERVRVLRAHRPWLEGVMVLEATQTREFTQDDIERVIAVLVSAEPI